MQKNNAVIVDSIRTGLAKSMRGQFNITRADNMVAHLINHLLKRNPNLKPANVDDVIIGCGTPEGPQGHNIARNAAVLSDLPIQVGGTTVNRYCSSGLQTIAMAASQIQANFYDCIIAGGVESISTMHEKMNMHDFVNDTLNQKSPGIYHIMGFTAETVAKRYNISRQKQDEYALLSQQRTATAQKNGVFDDEICSMKTTMQVIDKVTKEVVGTEETIVDQDTCNRPSTTLEALSSLRPVFDPENGTVTAGNSSQLSDGASITLVMSEKKALDLGLTPVAYFRGFTTVGCEPDEMGIGPVFSIPKLLERFHMSIKDIDLWELNEAFASQVVHIRDTLNLPVEKLNINGGSISIGHPYGMTGSRQVGHLIRELKRQKKQWGIVTMCVGGGMGATGLFENYDN
tara:strand:- start:569 stop:1771 length:1203 start_codon:yes stop_codon:yes gene_type:complete